MKFCCICLNSHCCIYSILLINILINIFILSILFIICYNIPTLKSYQIIYLIVALISWIILIFYYFYKLFLIILGKLSEEYQQKKLWKFVHFPPYIIIGIALIYDLIVVPYKSGSGEWLLYYILFFIISTAIIISGNIDFFGIRNQVVLSKSKSYKYPLNEESKSKDVNKSTASQ